MLKSKHNEVYVRNINITIATGVIVMFLLLSACSSHKKELADAISEKDSLPDMRTLGVTTLISDSGITRYRINAEEWLVYDKRQTPYWAFEKGIYLEKFDSLFQIDASIEADTAYYYQNKKLWELKGHVFINNLKGEKFNTEQLFWDQNKELIYSDKYIRIEQEEKIIMGYGFESNQQMTRYNIRNTSGVFPVKETPVDSLKTDTIR